MSSHSATLAHAEIICSFSISSVIKPLLFAGHVGLHGLLHFRPMSMTITTMSTGAAY
jgi:hypothetical protein